MSEWWTYGLRDFLMFSPQTYYRLFELYNLEWWPLQLLALALGAALVALAWRGGERGGRAAAAILALAWLWVAWAFHWQRYASINLAAGWVALAFALQGVLLAGAGAAGRLGLAQAGRVPGRIGRGLLLFAGLGFPLMAPLVGRGLAQAEVFGMVPDPTALATLAVLLLAGSRWWLFPIPLAWCLISGATLWAMRSPEFFVAPAAALLVVGLALTKARSGRSGG
jgi:hypothetical protein